MAFFDTLKNLFSSQVASEPPQEKERTTFCVHSAASGKMYTIDPANVTCTCPDWAESRCEYGTAHPSRICKHIASFYTGTPNLLPESLADFSDMIAYFSENGRGVPLSLAVVYSGTVGGKKIVITQNESSGGWANIYEGQNSFGLNLIDQRWAYGRWPEHWREIVPIVYKKCDPDLFQDIELFEMLAKDADDSFEQDRQKVESVQISWENTIFPMLVDAFDGNIPDWFQHEKRKEYFVIYKDNIRDWCFRVHYGALGVKRVEMKNGTEFRVTYDNMMYANSKKKFAKHVIEDMN